MPVENPTFVIRILKVMTNGYKNPDGSSVRGAKLLTSKGIKEIWEDQEDYRPAVEAFIKDYYRGRERLTNRGNPG